MTIHHCDRCGKEINLSTRRVFTHKLYFSKGFFDFLYETGSFNYSKKHELCPKCTEELIKFLEGDKHE